MSASEVTFRDRVGDDDKDTVRGILESTGFFYPEEIKTAVELVEERLSKGDSSGYFFLFAEEAGKTIGYACFGPIACTLASYDLFWIAVRGDNRGKGVGKQLLSKSEATIRRMGGRRIYVETSAKDLYAPTRSFYLKAGYRQEAELEDFYGPGDSKVIYVKALD